MSDAPTPIPSVSAAPDNDEGTDIIIGTIVIAVVVGLAFGGIIFCCKRMAFASSAEGRAKRKQQERERLRKLRKKQMEENGGSDDDDGGSGPLRGSSSESSSGGEDDGPFLSETASWGGSKKSGKRSKGADSKTIRDDLSSNLLSGEEEDENLQDAINATKLLIAEEREEQEKLRHQKMKEAGLETAPQYIPPHKLKSVNRSVMVPAPATRKLIPPEYVAPSWEPDLDPQSASSTALYTSRFHDPEALNLASWNEFTVYTPKHNSMTEEERREKMRQEHNERQQARQKKLEQRNKTPMPVLPPTTAYANSPLRPLAAAAAHRVDRVPSRPMRMTSVAPTDFTHMDETVL